MECVGQVIKTEITTPRSWPGGERLRLRGCSLPSVACQLLCGQSIRSFDPALIGLSTSRRGKWALRISRGAHKLAQIPELSKIIKEIAQRQQPMKLITKFWMEIFDRNGHTNYTKTQTILSKFCSTTHTHTCTTIFSTLIILTFHIQYHQSQVWKKNICHKSIENIKHQYDRWLVEHMENKYATEYRWKIENSTNTAR